MYRADCGVGGDSSNAMKSTAHTHRIGQFPIRLLSTLFLIFVLVLFLPVEFDKDDDDDDDDEEEMDDNPTSSIGDMETMHWIQRQVHEELQSNTQKWCQVAWGLCATETQHAKGCDVANYDGHLVWLYWRHLAANQASRSARVPVSCQDAKH